MNDQYSHCTVDVLILAGGQSLRMGQAKALLPVGDSTLLEHLIGQLPHNAIETVYISGDANHLPAVNQAVFLHDYLAEKHQGPLSGIAAALQVTTNDYLWVLSCDILQLPSNTLQCLLGKAQQTQADLVYACSNTARAYPLIALWHHTLVDQLIEYLLAGERRVLTFVEQVESVACVLPDLTAQMCNINTPDAYQVALARLKLG